MLILLLIGIRMVLISVDHSGWDGLITFIQI